MKWRRLFLTVSGMILAPIPELTDRKVSRKMEREGAELWNRK